MPLILYFKAHFGLKMLKNEKIWPFNIFTIAFFTIPNPLKVQDCIPGDQRKTVAWAYLRCINHVTNELNLNKRLRLQLFSPPKPAQSDELELSQIVSLISQTRKQKPGFYNNFSYNNFGIFFLFVSIKKFL